ncbi:hypothetical protein Neosp_014780 [[Neocosmospora] mangrovei]
MSPNGQAFLLDPDTPEGPTRYPHARIAPASNHRTLYISGMNEEWNKVFASRASAPARATIGVKELPDPRLIVEVKAVAVVEV